MFMVCVRARTPMAPAEFFGPFSTETAASRWAFNTLSMEHIKNEWYSVTSLQSTVEY